MDIKKMANDIGKQLGINNNQNNALMSAVDKAQDAMSKQTGGNILSVLQNNNIPADFIGKLKGYLNNPLYSVVITKLLSKYSNETVNKQNLLDKLNSIESYLSNNTSQKQPVQNVSKTSSNQSGSVLDKFKKGLKKTQK